jgi:hypothetical protein
VRFELLLSSVLVLGGISVAGAEPPTCPQPMKGSVHAGKYSFEYQSWFWKDGTAYIFCDCVRNRDSSAPLFFSWAGLSGFVEPGGTDYLYSPHSTDNKTVRTVPFWYGAAPSKVDAETIFPNEPGMQSGSKQTHINPVAWSPVADKYLLTTEARILVPYVASKTLAETIRETEAEGGVHLTPFQMIFTSKAVVDPISGKITSIQYTCEYLTYANQASLSFSDPKLQETLFTRSEPSPTWWPNHPNSPKDMRATFGGSLWAAEQSVNLAPDQIERKDTRMEVLGATGVVVGSIPVSYFVGK